MRTFRVLSWVAVSSKTQAEEDSPDSQSKGNKDFIASIETRWPGCRGEFVGEIRLAGTRNITSLERAVVIHPEYGELVDAIMSGDIDVLACREADRLGRRLGLISQIQDLCDACRVVIVSLNSGIPASLDPEIVMRDESRPIVAAVEAALSQVYIQKMRRLIRGGREARVVNKGEFSGKLPYGYRYKYAEDGTRTAELVESEAEVVLLFFRLYLQGHGSPYICKILIDMGVRTRKGVIPDHSFTRHLLSLAWVYAGFVQMYHAHPKNQPGKPSIKAQGSHPAIITAEMAAELGDEREARGYKRSISHTAFAGICLCAICGNPLGASSTNYTMKTTGEQRTYRIYTCKTPGCRYTSVALHTLIDHIRAAIVYLIENDVDLSLYSKIDVNRAQVLRDTIEEGLKAVKKISDSRARYIDLYAEEILSREELNAKLGTLDAAIAQKNAEIDQLRNELESVGDEASLLSRIESVRAYGLQYLDLIETDEERFNSWAKTRFRIHVVPGRDREKKIREIDYI